MTIFLKCPTCKGDGGWPGDVRCGYETCTTCDGDGSREFPTVEDAIVARFINTRTEAIALVLEESYGMVEARRLADEYGLYAPARRTPPRVVLGDEMGEDAA